MRTEKELLKKLCAELIEIKDDESPNKTPTFSGTLSKNLWQELLDYNKPQKRVAVTILAGQWVKGRGHRVSFVTEGEAGYSTGEDKEQMKTGWYWGDPKNEGLSYEMAEATAKDYNHKLGLTDQDVAEIILSSMAGGMRRGR